MDHPDIGAQRRMQMYDSLPPVVREAACYLDSGSRVIEQLAIHGQFMTIDEQLEKLWERHNRAVEYGEQLTGVKALVVGRIVHV
jgi:hypothetical protein